MSFAREQRSKITRYFRAFERTKIYDLVTASPVVAWYGISEYQQFSILAAQITARPPADLDAVFVVGILSQIVSLIFIPVVSVMILLRHVPIAKTSGLFPRIAAVAGAYIGVFIVLQPPQQLPIAVHFISVLLILGGVSFALYSIVTLGRSISLVPEARRLVMGGPYAVIRHPIYLGEALALSGITLEHLTRWSLLIFTLQCVFQFVRMTKEEQVLLGAFPEYKNYMNHTKRLLPGLY